MDDNISRQAAIDAVSDGLKGVFVEYRDVAEKMIGKLPSAQPEQHPITEDDYAYCAECDHGEMCRWYPMYGCEFKSRPTAERKGHWIDIACGSASLWKCSECGELFLEDFYYCPNCGAKMGAEE